jgi:hypothetical protein
VRITFGQAVEASAAVIWVSILIYVLWPLFRWIDYQWRDRARYPVRQYHMPRSWQPPPDFALRNQAQTNLDGEE